MKDSAISTLSALANEGIEGMAVAAAETLAAQSAETLQPLRDQLRSLLRSDEARIRFAGARIAARVEEGDAEVARVLFEIANLGDSASVYLEPAIRSGAAHASNDGESMLRRGCVRSLRRQSLEVLATLPVDSIEAVKHDLAELLSTGILKYGGSDGLSSLFSALRNVGAKLSGVEGRLFEALVRHYYSHANSNDSLWAIICSFPTDWALVEPRLRALARTKTQAMVDVYASEILEVYERRLDFRAGRVEFSTFAERYIGVKKGAYYMLGRHTDAFVAHMTAPAA